MMTTHIVVLHDCWQTCKSVDVSRVRMCRHTVPSSSPHSSYAIHGEGGGGGGDRLGGGDVLGEGDGIGGVVRLDESSVDA